MSFIYATDDPPENHIARLLLTNRPAPHKPSYGMDSPLGLVASNFLAPLYLYTSLKGKFNAWDKLLAKVPPEIFMYPSLDIGCGRGLVLMKIAERKKDVAFSMTRTPDPVYGIDLFIRGDQSGNAPEATYDNAASLNLTDYLTLHTANFIYLPFKDETMSLATASLSIHNADKASRKIALIEAARVLKPDGYLIILDLAGYIGQYKSVLKSMGWSKIQTEFGGMGVMFGAWPCYVLRLESRGARGRDFNEDDPFTRYWSLHPRLARVLEAWNSRGY